MDIQGTCDERFAPVRDAFKQSFDEGLELGAAAAVTVDGEFVVDLWAGDADKHGRPWEQDTIVNVYSTTKTMAAICMLMLSDRGLLDFDAPVAHYWPEFAQNGKERVLVRHVMAHTAGLSGFDPPLKSVAQLYDPDGLAAHLAAQRPWWDPGSASGYHSITQGHLQGEILYRITGRRMAEWFQTEVAEPLGADFWMSLPESEDHRVATLTPPVISDRRTINGVQVDWDSIAVRTLVSCRLTGNEPTTREWRAAEIPAGGGIGNARSVARIHSALACGGAVDGVRLLSEPGARVALEEEIDCIDQVLMVRMHHGLGFGFQLGTVTTQPGQAFWGGWGGSLAVVDFNRRMSIAYVMNHMESDMMGDPRSGRIVDAAQRCFTAPTATYV